MKETMYDFPSRLKFYVINTAIHNQLLKKLSILKSKRKNAWK